MSISGCASPSACSVATCPSSGTRAELACRCARSQSCPRRGVPRASIATTMAPVASAIHCARTKARRALRHDVDVRTAVGGVDDRRSADRGGSRAGARWRRASWSGPTSASSTPAAGRRSRRATGNSRDDRAVDRCARRSAASPRATPRDRTKIACDSSKCAAIASRARADAPAARAWPSSETSHERRLRRVGARLR